MHRVREVDQQEDDGQRERIKEEKVGISQELLSVIGFQYGSCPFRQTSWMCRAFGYV
jgi:hypothetical protein